ncbi:Pin-related site-specific recombinase/DNA invertase [Lacticaseibacillus paracasei]|nr:Pin-related site-specific recombinase/DNA invertase [Lacticaseibacillus paracasei]RHX70422.1 Pin-related site-specific recombinase/DNA invertase [Lacticaseibacillus paracasei]
MTNIIEAIRYREVQLKVLSLPSFASIEGLNFHNLITAIIVDLYKYIAQENREPIKMPQQQSIEIAKQENIRTKFSNMGLIQLIFKKPIFIKRHVAILNKKKVNCLYRTHDLIVVCRHIN